MLLADVVLGPPEMAVAALPFLAVFGLAVWGIHRLLRRPAKTPGKTDT